MSPISSTSSSSASNAQAVYQEYLARLAAQKQTAAAKQTTQAAPVPAADVDHDGDSK
jgi:hypothetical protein